VPRGQGMGPEGREVTADPRLLTIDTQAALAALQEACADRGLRFSILSTQRTCAEQDAIYAQGRTAPGNIVTQARGCVSWHVLSRAIDVQPLRADGTPDSSPEAYRAIADVAKGKTLIADALKKHPETQCIVALWSYSAGVALGGIEQSGKKPGEVKVIAFDESPETQAGIEAGTVQASIVQDQYRIGYEAVRVLASAVRGLEQGGPTGPRMIYLPVHVLRQDNLEDLRAQNRVRRLEGSSTQPAGGRGT